MFNFKKEDLKECFRRYCGLNLQWRALLTFIHIFFFCFLFWCTFEKSFLSVFPVLMSLGSFVQLFTSLVDLPSKFVFLNSLVVTFCSFFMSFFCGFCLLPHFTNEQKPKDTKKFTKKSTTHMGVVGPTPMWVFARTFGV